MNEFAAHGLDEDAFGEKRSAGLRSFDAFPKTKPSYTSPTRRGGQWTVLLLVVSALLTLSELRTWWRGTESHHFSVEKGVSRAMQMNIDIVVRMPCEDLRIDIQDAAGDHIVAGMLLTKDPTNWQVWNEKLNREISAGVFEYQTLNAEDTQRLMAQEEDVHAQHVIAHVRNNPRRKFPQSPKLRKGVPADSCRIYGSLEGNKVLGDMHITARGHGYQELGEHLPHDAFNFSHMITELSFGPHYPSLLNPLDKTIATTDSHYYRYQYFLNIVPTIYSERSDAVERYTANPSRIHRKPRDSIFTNQYAATSQSSAIPENAINIPGIFFKYNIEPILLFVTHERRSLLSLLVRVINVVSGVLVAGGWLFQLSDWATEVFNRRRNRRMEGVLNGRIKGEDE
ncbi:hypothetical protein VTN31DRAFT_5261 [Thermomyces dupontii]|uniref:uncharacterized protein n=1 Tax=Talaromyces thermophilus TaxID=28565 RepID=UPI00374430F5